MITVTDVRSSITSSQTSSVISVRDPEQMGNSFVWKVTLWSSEIEKNFLQVRIASLHNYQRLNARINPDCKRTHMITGFTRRQYAFIVVYKHEKRGFLGPCGGGGLGHLRKKIFRLLKERRVLL